MLRKGLSLPLAVIAVGLALTAGVLARTNDATPRLLQQSTAYPGQTSGTSTTGYPPSGTSGTARPTTPSPAAATTSTVTVITGTVTLTPPTLAPTTPTALAAVQATAFVPTPTPTLELSGDVQCPPGGELSVSGKGPPRAPILLYFGQRVVGGGSIEANGTFTLPLLVGMEVPGDHVVSVRVRGSNEVLTEFTCSVAPVTPTPLPARRTP